MSGEGRMINDDVMTLVFTNDQCAIVCNEIDQSETQDHDLIALRIAMYEHALGLARFPFLAYVRQGDDEILPGFKLTDYSMKVDRVIEVGREEA